MPYRPGNSSTSKRHGPSRPDTSQDKLAKKGHADHIPRRQESPNVQPYPLPAQKRKRDRNVKKRDAKRKRNQKKRDVARRRLIPISLRGELKEDRQEPFPPTISPTRSNAKTTIAPITQSSSTPQKKGISLSTDAPLFFLLAPKHAIP